MKRWRKWLKRLLWLAVGGVVALLILWGVMLALMYRWVAKPPVLAETPAIVSLTPEKRGDRVYLGANWFGQRDGLPVLYLTGTPFEMGYANGVLTQKLIHQPGRFRGGAAEPRRAVSLDAVHAGIFCHLQKPAHDGTHHAGFADGNARHRARLSRRASRTWGRITTGF